MEYLHPYIFELFEYDVLIGPGNYLHFRFVIFVTNRVPQGGFIAQRVMRPVNKCV